MSYPARTIAAVIVQKAIDEGKPITQMKLQKMVYFAQGVNLVKNDEPLIDEEIQAWKFGPVIPAIYNEFKFYGNLPITDIEITGLKVLAEQDLPEEVQKVIEYTWEATKGLSAIQLSNWTHNDGSPWKKVYNESDYAIPIQNQLIKEYFNEFLDNGQN